MQDINQEDTMDLKEKEEALNKKEEELAAKEQELSKMEQAMIQRLKGNLYDKIPVSVGTMDKLIAVLVVILVLCLGVGIYQGIR